MDEVKKTKQKPRGAAALGPGPGRPKGVPNKATTAFRETVQTLLERNTENVAIWLQTVAEGKQVTMVSKDGKEYQEYVVNPDPGKALDLISKLAEYAAPKLSRTEVVGDNDSPLAHKVEIAIIDAAK